MILLFSCHNALYHLFYKDDIEKDLMIEHCLADQVRSSMYLDMNCMYYINYTLPFEYICENCQINFLFAVAIKKFTKIKI